MWRAGLIVVAAVVVATIAVPTIPDNYQPLIGHQVWDVSGPGRETTVRALAIDGLVDVLDHSGTTGRIRVGPGEVDKVSTTLQAASLTHTVIINDLAHFFIQEEENSRKLQRRDVQRRLTRACTATSCTAPLSDKFMTFQQMEYYLKSISSSPRVELKSLGKSHQGRDIWMVHIKPIIGRAKPKIAYSHMKKRAIWIEGGLHAREWISPAVTLNLIHSILTDFPANKPFDIYIVPMANPDGYIKTWSDNRLWRKNVRDNPGTNCDGVDLNRNWDAHWGVGASNEPCSEVYKGTKPFSEPETLALSREMMRVNNIIPFDLVLSIHSYGQVIMYPWGWTTNNAPHTKAMKKMGNLFSKHAQASSGIVYEVINSAGEFYYASGATDDWAKQALGTKYVYTIELRDKGVMGFSLSASQIKPTAVEVWDGLRIMLKAIAPEKAFHRPAKNKHE